MRTGPRALRGVPGLLTDQAKDVLVRGVLGKAERPRKVTRLITRDTYSRS